MDSNSTSDLPGVTRRDNAWFGAALRRPRAPRLNGSILRNQLWVRADQQIAALVEALKARSAADLRQLLETPQTCEVREGRLVVTITAHAHVEHSGALAVIVEARQSRAGGFVHTVSADGFFIHPDGTIASMKEVDLWNHGY